MIMAVFQLSLRLVKRTQVNTLVLTFALDDITPTTTMHHTSAAAADAAVTVTVIIATTMACVRAAIAAR